MTVLLTKQLLALAIFSAIVSVFLAASPTRVLAEPFGGQVEVIHGCIKNIGDAGGDRIYVFLGPPRGGPYIWTTTTHTYPYGPPSHVGQWLLGLGGVPYSCVVSIFPTVTNAGTYIMMMGSSQ